MKELINGIQHLGLPTNNLEKTLAFYESIGFETAHRTKDGDVPVVFLRLGSLTIETYENGQAVGKVGAIAHVALDVSNVEAAYAESKRLGHKILDAELRGLPFWKNGVRFYNIEGPNGEIVEFSQIL